MMLEKFAFKGTLWFRAVLIVVAMTAIATGRIGAGEAAYLAYKAPESLEDLREGRIGVLKGSVFIGIAKAGVAGATIVELSDTQAQIAGLLDGTLDAVVTDEPVARLAVADNPALGLLPEKIKPDQYAFAARYYYGDLVKDMNELIDELREDGTLDEMVERWLDGPASGRSMPELPEYEAGEPLRFGIAPVLPPMSYHDSNGKPTGFDIELAKRLAYKLKLRLVLTEMDFAELIPRLRKGEVEMIGSSLSITPERVELVQFTDSYLDGSAAAIVRVQ